MVQLETLEVGDTCPEKKNRTIAVEHEAQILTVRWVFPKRLQSFGAWLVVCDCASGAESAGIYAPTSIRLTRVVFAFSVVESMSLLQPQLSSAALRAMI